MARAFLKNAKILIFDEATSALDSITEKNIQTNLELLIKDKTTIIIAHRLSSILNMDRILVFDNGQIVGEGNHHFLITHNALYKKLWMHQTNHSEAKE